ncbi:hypothetical protein AB4Z55_26325 [Gordonia sp. ABKF26]|uniref:hypothetical protein n=1 Tax=Gordonia sp. ABKF26 TaxID=3238687 RepID=UPI0034E4CB79
MKMRLATISASVMAGCAAACLGAGTSAAGTVDQAAFSHSGKVTSDYKFTLTVTNNSPYSAGCAFSIFKPSAADAAAKLATAYNAWYDSDTDAEYNARWADAIEASTSIPASETVANPPNIVFAPGQTQSTHDFAEVTDQSPSYVVFQACVGSENGSSLNRVGAATTYTITVPAAGVGTGSLGSLFG